jgi:DNA-directed RNA polymerase
LDSRRIFIKNKKSNYAFYFNNENVLNNLCNNWAQIDSSFLEEIRDDYCNQYKIKKENIDSDYTSLIDALKKASKENNKDLVTLLSREISIYQQLKKFNLALSTNIGDKKIFFPFEFDFRGRIYFFSLFSFTFQKEFRYCLYRGHYDKEKIPK